jgi:hypothetical protein
MSLSVAQVGNLLYRRLVVGRLLAYRAAADCQSATRQTASLRYDTLRAACSAFRVPHSALP